MWTMKWNKIIFAISKYWETVMGESVTLYGDVQKVVTTRELFVKTWLDTVALVKTIKNIIMEVES